jgi:AraC family transcriptional regulator, transcriptional activator of pobA
MSLFNINDYLPLTEKEFIYKNIFLENPEFEFDKPKTTKHIDSLLEKLNFNTENLISPIEISSKKESMNEGLFPQNNDVIISRHLRYSPCFIHTHSFFEIIYVLNGSCRNKISDIEIEMKKGDVCIVTPGTIHALSVFDDNCVVINLLVRSTTFEKSFFGILKSNDVLSSFFSHALYSSNSESYLLFTEQNDIHTINSVLEMYTEFNSNYIYSDRMLTSMMSSFFIRLLRTDAKNIIVPTPSGTHSYRNIIYILNHIFTNYTTITLKDLSLKYNYSERQMARILKEYTGKTFMNIIQDIKLQKACELLKNPNISINKIIESIGYSNTTHFYKIFKNHYNITPINYRNNINKK